jgi:hypothetical protein
MGKIDTSIDTVLRYENGDLDDQETIEFFQQLVDTGLAWKLQGHYGRAATRLIEAGLIETR